MAYGCLHKTQKAMKLGAGSHPAVRGQVQPSGESQGLVNNFGDLHTYGEQPNIGVLHFNTFLAPGRLMPKKYILFFFFFFFFFFFSEVYSKLGTRSRLCSRVST